jgi:hypothetical protein
MASHRLGVRVSAADLAIQYNASHHAGGGWEARHGFDLPEGGFSAKAIEAARLEGGLCPEHLLRSDSYNLLDRDNGIFYTIQNINQIHQSDHLRSCDIRTASAQAMMPGLSASVVADVIRQGQNNRVLAWAELAKKACEGRRVRLPSTDRIQTMRFADGARWEQMQQRIDASLEAGDVPLVAYHVGRLPLTNPLANAVPRLFRGWGAHASTIVGREWDSRRSECVYRVRNTWGEQCDPNFQNCRDGHFLLTANELDWAIFEVQWFEPLGARGERGR